MKDSLHPSDQESLGARFSAAPLEVRTYAVFAAAVTVLGCGLDAFGPKSVKEAIIPFTGWAPYMSYMFTLYFAFALIFAKSLPRRTGIIGRFAIIAILFIGIFAGYQHMKQSGKDDHGNPYLAMSQWQPVWTMIIPAFWIMTLLSPRVNKYYASRDASPSA